MSDFPPVEWDARNERPWDNPSGLPDRSGFRNTKFIPRPQAFPTMGSPLTPVGQAISDPHHYAQIIEGNSAPGLAGSANTLVPFLLSPSTKRNLLGLRNGSASGGANIYIGFGNIASTFSWLALAPGQEILFDEVVPQNDLYATADAASAVLAYAVSTIPG